jgi:PAS domain S-box-containing protein
MLPPDHPAHPAPLQAINVLQAATAFRVVNQISAMVAYWDADQRCVFSNEAYQQWFGRKPAEMLGMSLRDLLGPLYEKNRPYIEGALRGEIQVFERQIPLPGGGTRDSVATYTPDLVGGVVRGFSVHVADVTALRQREAELAAAIREAIRELERTKDSFRSKNLGELRVRLAKVLARLEGP